VLGRRWRGVVLSGILACNLFEIGPRGIPGPMSVNREDVMVERVHGTVKWFDKGLGYGFLGRNVGKDVFCHYSAIAGDGFRELRPDQPVVFEVRDTDRGPEAVNVWAVEGASS